jgi:outer membrane protein
MSSARWHLLAMLGCLGAAGAVHAQSDARALDERGVVELVQKQNPDLKAALFRLESSRQDVTGLSERYATVVQVDGSASDVTNPSLMVRGLTPDGTILQGINRNRMRRVDLGAELRKHLVWGTDLSLRLSGALYETQNIRPAVVVPDMGTTAVGVGGFVFPRNLGPGYLMNAKLTLKQPLLRGFGSAVAEADLNAARAERSGAEHTRDRVASELLRDALGAYWELWYADSALQIQQAGRELALRQRDDAQQRVDTGTLAPVEVLAFETELAARDEDVANAEAERKRAELELARLLGGVLQGLGMASDAGPAEGLSGSGLVLEQDALANSAEVQERAAALELARVRARTAADPQRHRLDLDSYVQLSGLSTENPADALSQYANTNSVSGFVGLTYEAPVTSRAQRAAAAKARADVEAAAQDLASVKQRVLAEAHKAEERGRAQERGVALAEQTRAIAEKQLAAEQARFQSGSGTTLEVIVSEARVREARLRVARARANLAQTTLSLAHLTGRLLSRWTR